ncbi:hypothetical protein BLA6992_01405 [Burkholderia lata]|nr:hypothetical protein BLA6992_01405 [Burkholderia lata]
MTDSNATSIVFIGVLAGDYVNNFVAEDYHRFCDGTALVGELASHIEAFPCCGIC